MVISPASTPVPSSPPRSQLAIIPQEPFLFSGTVRENLDPRGLYEDGALWQALEQCHLSEVIESMGECPVLCGGGRSEQRRAGGGSEPRGEDAVLRRWSGW